MPPAKKAEDGPINTSLQKNQNVDDLTEQIENLGLRETSTTTTTTTADGTQNLENELCMNDDDSIPPHFKKVARWISEGSAKNIVVLSGAGVSCSAGIPDFRTPGTGLYDNLQKYNLPYPEAVFDLNFYRRNPKPFCSLAKEIWPGLKHSPTLTHSFVALLSKKGRLLRNYSQNIDGLEYLASIPAEEIIECHGHFRTASCIRCNTEHDSEECKQIILEEERAPKCKRCGNNVKPDIVFFGEDLPSRFHKLLRKDLAKTDLLLIMGTSLMVAPVSLIPERVSKSCRRVLVNRELVGNISPSEGEDSKGRDVWLGGDCDDSILQLSKLLGWENELYQLNKKTRIISKGKTTKTNLEQR
mmetsp:Transcript_17608/g.24769  ORF Transcript_17608/g.24769 Transcript_17608/m.24769 type:complete len:357 (-) Transcript_17608:706-1776(-)